MADTSYSLSLLEGNVPRYASIDLQSGKAYTALFGLDVTAEGDLTGYGIAASTDLNVSTEYVIKYDSGSNKLYLTGRTTEGNDGIEAPTGANNGLFVYGSSGSGSVSWVQLPTGIPYLSNATHMQSIDISGLNDQTSYLLYYTATGNVLTMRELDISALLGLTEANGILYKNGSTYSAIRNPVEGTANYMVHYNSSNSSYNLIEGNAMNVTRLPGNGLIANKGGEWSNVAFPTSDDNYIVNYSTSGEGTLTFVSLTPDLILGRNAGIPYRPSSGSSYSFIALPSSPSPGASYAIAYTGENTYSLQSISAGVSNTSFSLVRPSASISNCAYISITDSDPSVFSGLVAPSNATELDYKYGTPYLARLDLQLYVDPVSYEQNNLQVCSTAGTLQDPHEPVDAAEFIRAVNNEFGGELQEPNSTFVLDIQIRFSGSDVKTLEYDTLYGDNNWTVNDEDQARDTWVTQTSIVLPAGTPSLRYISTSFYTTPLLTQTVYEKGVYYTVRAVLRQPYNNYQNLKIVIADTSNLTFIPLR